MKRPKWSKLRKERDDIVEDSDGAEDDEENILPTEDEVQTKISR